MTTQNDRQIVEAVREHYGAAARTVLTENQSGCCTSEPAAACCGGDSSCCAADGITDNLYQVDELAGLPLKAALASLGCGNPTALAQLEPGQTVLDLGSGGGIDVLLSARRVGPTGFAYGLDMTDDMLQLARQNAAQAGATNVEFLKGDIASIPLPSNTIDVLISNCVINLAVDKAPVLEEAFRVLKPGGRFAISDIVIHGGLPADLVDTVEFRRDLSSWSGCIAGALTDDEYHRLLSAAGFTAIDLEVTRRYSIEQVGASFPVLVERLGTKQATELVSRFASTFVRATKPHSDALTLVQAEQSSCCTPETQGQPDCCAPHASSCCSTASGADCCS
ncbi:MAG: arsenite methyltransferase [Herpetosiphonaceae bacterium]|nr:arsenite methyltransferase [Herpetosiphonaceae bacterium]